MRGQLPRLAAVDGEQVDLRKLVVAALRDEGDGFAVGRPSRVVLVFRAVRKLRRLTAVQPCAPDVRQAPPALPVGVAPREHDVTAVRRDLRIGQPRQAQQIDDAHRPRRLRPQPDRMCCCDEQNQRKSDASP